ncbi:phosphatase 2C-like domain-containing protein [Pavlovales sp. CCMP2436]|nr:phosphatase 2C-like domain-containing protein [Pavlovales sp. CCMP2436]
MGWFTSRQHAEAVHGPSRKQVDGARAAFVVKGEDTMASELLVLDDGRKLVMNAVYDGHGGPLAARYLAVNMHTRITDVYGNLADTMAHQARLEMALLLAFEKLDKEIRADSELDGHGSTASVVLIPEARADGPRIITVANVGDSGVFLYDVDGSFRPLFGDHRVTSCNAAELRRVVDGGGEIRQAYGPDGTLAGPKRIYPGGLMMTRTIGDADASDLVIARPDITCTPYPALGGWIAVGSDGVWDFLAQEVVSRLVLLAQKPSLGPQWLSQALITNAMEKNDGTDDATIIAIALAPLPKSAARRRSAFFGLGGAYEPEQPVSRIGRPRAASTVAPSAHNFPHRAERPNGGRRLSAGIGHQFAGRPASRLESSPLDTDGPAAPALLQVPGMKPPGKPRFGLFRRSSRQDGDALNADPSK